MPSPMIANGLLNCQLSIINCQLFYHVQHTHTFLCLYCRPDFSFPPEGASDAFRPVEDE